jgi:hypothetical protein
VVDLSAATDLRVREHEAVRAGTLPVLAGRPAAGGTVPASARVSVLQQSTVDRGVRPVVLRVARADGSAAATRMRVTVDYSGFRDAYGGDWANVAVPASSTAASAEGPPASKDRHIDNGAGRGGTGCDRSRSRLPGTGGPSGTWTASSAR